MSTLRHRTIEILGQLVAFDSVSRNSNIPLLEWVEAYLSEHGVDHRRIDYVSGTKANLFSTIGPAEKPGLILSGHTDVVPVDDQNWTSDPFTLVEREGKLYARGSADMKGFIAICLALVPQMVSSQLQRPIHFAFSCDEEVGCKGVGPLIAELSKREPLPFGAIVGEPTSMQVVTGQKGTLTYDTVVTGVPTHSCDPRLGVNAITAASALIQKIEEITGTLITRGDPENGFDPPWSTVNVGLISGGTQKNIVPSSCEFRWECRPLPMEDIDASFAPYYEFENELRNRMQAAHPSTDIATTLINRVAGLQTPPNSEVEVLAKRAARRNDTGTVSFASEAGLFQETGVPTVLCGPGSIDQAHKADEFLSIEQLDRGIEFVESLVQAVSEADI